MTSTPTYALWRQRFLAFCIDTVLWLVISIPLMLMVLKMAHPGSRSHAMEMLDSMNNWFAALSAVVTVVFWVKMGGATPGKALLKIHVVDETTLGPLSWEQGVRRQFGYVISLLCLGIGFLWPAFDPRAQGWHDKIAGTLVIRKEAVATV